MDINIFIRENIADTIKGNLYLSPDIPKGKLNNAAKSMRIGESIESVIALYDDTLFGSANDGMIFTGEKLIFKCLLEDAVTVNYADIKSCDYVEESKDDKDKEVIRDFVDIKLKDGERVKIPKMIKYEVKDLCLLIKKITQEFDSFQEQRQIVPISEMPEKLKTAYLKIIANMTFCDDNFIDQYELQEIYSLMTRLNLSSEAKLQMREYIASIQEMESVDKLIEEINNSCPAKELSDYDNDLPLLSSLDTINFRRDMNWSEYKRSIEDYADQNNINLKSDPFCNIMSKNQRMEIRKRIDNEFTFRNTDCDKYDYLIAGTCGTIGGLIDVIFVGLPGEGALTHLADDQVNSAVEKFAGLLGWEGPKEGADPTGSAIGYLERNFKVNYDQSTTFGKNGTDGAVPNLSCSNHHVKSLAHSPDIIGLFFSILNQFTDTSTFVSNGQLITIDTRTNELRGGNFVAKIFSAFVNWIGHLFSDVAGSSGASGRGSGIPIPFYNFLLLVKIGEIGQHKQTIATVATKVFEKGYDFRHGIAMSIPVLITELLTRFMWVIKQRFYHNNPWEDCIPSSSDAELRRMLLVSHGTLCVIDAGDAALKSGGEVILFLLRINLIGWTRFGILALREVSTWYNTGKLDVVLIDKYLDEEYRKMLRQ
ncbi:MAG: hypothetical protein OXE94_14915 [Aestuariivita sp.]|nr:hypothetical protein [Aestuariivita sp.]